MSDIITIDDTNYQLFIDPVVDGQVMYCTSYGMFQTGLGDGPTLAESGVPLIPESDWDDVIRKRKRHGSTVRELCEDRGLEVLSQGSTNYCWCNGVHFAAMVARLQETGQVVRYSPASVAAPIKNFRNRGGWGQEALDWMIDKGANLQEDWPANAIDRRYYNDENKAKALKHKVLEYYRCRSWKEVGSAILAGWPVAVGYNWWGHLVCGIDLIEGSHDLVIANSWGKNWSDNGFGILKGRKKIPDGESVAITSMTAM